MSSLVTVRFFSRNPVTRGEEYLIFPGPEGDSIEVGAEEPFTVSLTSNQDYQLVVHFDHLPDPLDHYLLFNPREVQQLAIGRDLTFNNPDGGTFWIRVYSLAQPLEAAGEVTNDCFSRPLPKLPTFATLVEEFSIDYLPWGQNRFVSQGQ